MDDAWLHARWDEIEERIFSGEHVISTYEQFAGKPFPARLKPRIVEAVDFVSAFYRRAERIPGVAAGQHAVGGALRRAVRTVTRGARSVRDRVWRRRR